jgi:hypothetical protein
MENLLSKTPYKFKKSYGGTPEPLPPEYPPCRRGPSLKIEIEDRFIDWKREKKIKSGLFIESRKFKRPRGRCFF